MRGLGDGADPLMEKRLKGSRWHIFPRKMTPKWHQDGSKMAPRWPLGGSWGRVGSKIAPRWSQEGFKSENVRSFPPCWGPRWDPIWDMFGTRMNHKRLQEALR